MPADDNAAAPDDLSWDDLADRQRFLNTRMPSPFVAKTRGMSWPAVVALRLLGRCVRQAVTAVTVGGCFAFLGLPIGYLGAHLFM